MKVRTSFVANSSSSSFIIAVKQIPEVEGIIYGKVIKKLMKKFTSSEPMNTIDQLNEKFADNYCYNSIEELFAQEGEWAKERYNSCAEAINNGYSVYEGSIDYNDETGNDFMSDLDMSDDGSGIYKISFE